MFQDKNHVHETVAKDLHKATVKPKNSTVIKHQTTTITPMTKTTKTIAKPTVPPIQNVVHENEDYSFTHHNLTVLDPIGRIYGFQLQQMWLHF